MSTLIKRFFTRNETKELYEDRVRNPRFKVLDFLYDRASNSIHLEGFEKKLSNCHFDRDSFVADLQLTEFFLTAENYLINKDPRFIQSAMSLRTTAKQEFPDLLDHASFNLLVTTSEQSEAAHSSFIPVTYVEACSKQTFGQQVGK